MSKLVTMVLLAGTVLMAGCNTVAGAGTDLSNGGHAITNEANKVAQ